MNQVLFYFIRMIYIFIVETLIKILVLFFFNFRSTASMTLLAGMSDRLPFSIREVDTRKEDFRISQSFPSSYPLDDLALATRLIVIQVIAEGVWFGKKCDCTFYIIFFSGVKVLLPQLRERLED